MVFPVTSDAVQSDVTSSPQQQVVDTKSSRSLTSSPSLASSSSSSSASTTAQRHVPAQTQTGSDVTSRVAMSPVAAADDEVRPTATSTSAGPPLRRRAVDLSDLRSCALVHTQMKTRKASTSWRYVVNVVFLYTPQ